MISRQPCDRCGVTLPRATTAGLCPACLIRLVTGEDTATVADGSPAAMTDAMPRVGSRIGDYLLEAPLGGGGMGVVYRARQISLNRLVALKMLPFGRFSLDADRERFQAEAEAIAQLRHPNIVAIYEIGERDGQPYISMECVDGPDLATLTRTRSMSSREAAGVVARVARAIQYAHQRGIFHRDLKPSNILMEADGQPRVTDFGLAKNLSDEANLTRPGQTLGSPSYLPPERATLQADVNLAASDVYGMGAILYHLLTGRPPFVGETMMAVLRQVAESEPVAPRLLNPDVPRDLETLCLKCLEKDPASRFGSAGHLAEELERFLRDEPIRSRPISAAARGWRWCRRRPALAAMSAITMVTVCVGLTTSLLLWRRARDRAQQAAASLLRVELDRAEDFFSRDDSPEALARLAYLLRSNPANRILSQRIVSALTHRNFLLPASTEVQIAHDGRAPPATALFGDRLVGIGVDAQKISVWNLADGFELEREWTLAEPARLAALSRDGARLAVILRDGTVQFRTTGVASQLIATGTLSASPVAIRWNSSGSRLLALAAKGVDLLDTNTGGVLATLPDAHFAEFSPDGKWLVAAANTEAVIWDAKTARPTGRALRHLYRLETARFSADSTRVVTASGDMSACIWNVASGERMGRPLIHQEQLLDAVFSPDGQRVLTESLSAKAQLWDAVAGIPMSGTFPQRHELHGEQFSPDGFWLISHYQDRIWLRDAFTGKSVSEPLRLAGTASVVCFLADGRRFVTVNSEGNARVWATQLGDAAPLQLRHELEVIWAGFDPAGTRIFACAKDRSARIWSAADARPISAPMLHERRLTCGTWDSSGLRVATGDFSGKVRVWDATSGALKVGPLIHPDPITSVVFAPDGRWLVSSSGDGVARVWNATDGSLVWETRHVGAVHAIAVSGDGLTVATAGEDGVARVTNVANGERLAEFKVSSAVLCVAFSPFGQSLVTGDRRGDVRFWDLAKNAEHGAALHHGGAALSLRFSMDGRLLVTASSDQTARVWDVTTRRALSRPLTHTASVVSASLSPDGRHVLTASMDHTARVWDTATGQPVSDALAHGNRVVAAEWSPDGKRIVTSSFDRSARIWTLPLLHAPHPEAEWLAGAAEAFGGLRLAEDERVVRSNLEGADGEIVAEPSSFRRIVGGRRFVAAEGTGVERKRQYDSYSMPAARAPGDDEASPSKIAVARIQTGQVARPSPEQGPPTILGSETATAAPPSLASETREWMQWLVAERSERTMAPGYLLRAEEYLRTRLDDTRADRLREALGWGPMSAEGLARWSQLVVKESIQRNPRKSGEASFAAELAVQRFPESFEAWWSLAEARLGVGEREAAKAAFERALKHLPKTMSAGDKTAFENLKNRL